MRALGEQELEGEDGGTAQPGPVDGPFEEGAEVVLVRPDDRHPGEETST
jgi:hypothetical protein